MYNRHDLRSGPFSLYAVAPSIGQRAGRGGRLFRSVRGESAPSANERQAGGHERVPLRLTLHVAIDFGGSGSLDAASR